MNVDCQQLKDLQHGSSLLRKLNLQRVMGQFCDCVIHLHLKPGKLFLAHKSVLAASSPVLASLLPNHGTLLELDLPHLSVETLDALLEYIYTGFLPPLGQEGSVLLAAMQLQMGDLQQALMCRQGKLLPVNTGAVENQLSRKRKCAELQPPFLSDGSARSLPPSPSCEVVPVICRVSTTRHNKLLLGPQTQSRDSKSDVHIKCRESNTTFEQDAPRQPPRNKHGLHSDRLIDRLFVDSQVEHGKPVKAEACVHECPQDVSKKVVGYGQYGSSSDFEDAESQSRCEPAENFSPTSPMSSKTADRNEYIRTTQTLYKDAEKSKDASVVDFIPANEFHQHNLHNGPQTVRSSRCILDYDSYSAFKQNEFGKDRHFPHVSPNIYDMKTTHSRCAIGDKRRHMICQLSTDHCAETQDSVCPEETSEHCNQITGVLCETSGSDHLRAAIQTEPRSQRLLSEDTCREIPPVNNSNTSNTFTSTIVNTDGDEIHDVLSQKTDNATTYQGQLRYHCLPTASHSALSSSSDDNGPYTPVTSDLYMKGGSPITEGADGLELASETRGLPHEGDEVLPSGGGAAQPYQCSVCERAFSQRGSLNRHVRSHLGVRPYSCPQCPMTFSRQYRVTEHMRVHQRSCEDLQRAGAT